VSEKLLMQTATKIKQKVVPLTFVRMTPTSMPFVGMILGRIKLGRTTFNEVTLGSMTLRRMTRRRMACIRITHRR
jgi:hypothetical protein